MIVQRLILHLSCPSASGSETLEPRHHPEHSAGSGRRPRHSGAVLRPGEDVFPQHPLL